MIGSARPVNKRCFTMLCSGVNTGVLEPSFDELDRAIPRGPAKKSGASRFPEKRPIWTAVSRILSARVATSRMTIYLTPPVKAASRSCDQCDYYPGANGQATQLPVLSCTAWGFSCPGACAPGGELLPRRFTLTGVAPGGLFSVTLSVAASFRQRPPHILCGMLPWGVRTFL